MIGSLSLPPDSLSLSPHVPPEVSCEAVLLGVVPSVCSLLERLLCLGDDSHGCLALPLCLACAGGHDGGAVGGGGNGDGDGLLLTKFMPSAEYWQYFLLLQGDSTTSAEPGMPNLNTSGF